MAFGMILPNIYSEPLSKDNNMNFGRMSEISSNLGRNYYNVLNIIREKIEDLAHNGRSYKDVEKEAIEKLLPQTTRILSFINLIKYAPFYKIALDNILLKEYSPKRIFFA